MKEIFVEIPGQLRPIYGQLKRIQDSDADQVVRYHAGLALGELDTIVRGELFNNEVRAPRIEILR